MNFEIFMNKIVLIEIRSSKFYFMSIFLKKIVKNHSNLFCILLNSFHNFFGDRCLGSWELTRSNMPFTIGIQTEWQCKMKVRYGHHGGIALDATFGTNEKKVPPLLLQCFQKCSAAFLILVPFLS